MAAIIQNVTDLVNASIDWITSYVGVITGQPLILMFVIFGFIGTGIGLIKRLIRM